MPRIPSSALERAIMRQQAKEAADRAIYMRRRRNEVRERFVPTDEEFDDIIREEDAMRRYHRNYEPIPYRRFYRNPDPGIYRNPDPGIYRNPDPGIYRNPDPGIYRNPDPGIYRNPDPGIYRYSDEYERLMPDYGSKARSLRFPADRIPSAGPEEGLDYGRPYNSLRRRTYPEYRTMEYRYGRDDVKPVRLDDGVFRPNDPRYRDARLTPMADFDYEDVVF